MVNYKDILYSNYFLETYTKIEEMKKDFPVNHGFIHINNVVKNAERISSVFNLTDRQRELLLVACALHDIGYLAGRDDHAFNGAILAKKYLENNSDLEKKDIDIICNAIRNHGGKKVSDFEDSVSMCLAIADKLDFIGSRYNKNMLSDEKSAIFPNILDTVFEILDDCLVLKIIVTKCFDVRLFENSSYFTKLNQFFGLLSEKLGLDFKMIYVIN